MEAGSHRWQRIPPTEKRGRVQTSTITVAVMSGEEGSSFSVDRREVDRKYCRSGGKGGQNVNKVESCVVLTHLPTGITVRSEENRTQGKNEEAAWKRLEAKLGELHRSRMESDANRTRSNQIGNGERSDKRRTYREQDGFVQDHITGKRITMKELYKGNIGVLHK